jgi:ProP effector
MFGATFLPMKLGIFQELLAAHPETFEKDSLKAALSHHARSTRYLTAVASGADRFDLQGKPVEAMAPEHVHHALLEVFRRRQTRTNEDLRPKLLQRIVVAFEASGLTPQAYTELVRSRDETANAVLDEAMAEASAQAAKTEALAKAFQASGKTVEVFADMYGLDPRAVSRMLARATAA